VEVCLGEVHRQNGLVRRRVAGDELVFDITRAEFGLVVVVVVEELLIDVAHVEVSLDEIAVVEEVSFGEVVLWHLKVNVHGEG